MIYDKNTGQIVEKKLAPLEKIEQELEEAIEVLQYFQNEQNRISIEMSKWEKTVDQLKEERSKLVPIVYPEDRDEHDCKLEKCTNPIHNAI